jgi:hypothetical protein
MISRCGNPKEVGYKNYGGRGIGVCERWRISYTDFLSDMGRAPTATHSIDRIDSNSNYEPMNCRWATQTEQVRNRRITLHIEIDGVTKTAIEWADLSGQNYHSFYKRIVRGWTGARLLSPSEKRCKQK